LSAEEASDLYRAFYKDAAFTFVTDKNPDLKQAVNTNKCVLYLEKYGDKLLIISVIDNLLKGASGQAVQNFNLMFGLDEKAGLMLKASAF
jgi:N-acetyl-gamma-glutamyl-phosphate reductase